MLGDLTKDAEMTRASISMTYTLDLDTFVTSTLNGEAKSQSVFIRTKFYIFLSLQIIETNFFLDLFIDYYFIFLLEISISMYELL